MIKLFRSIKLHSNIKSLINPSSSSISARLIHLTSTNGLKKIEIAEDKEKKHITIQGKYLDSEKIFGNKVLKLSSDDQEQTSKEDYLRPCAFCELEKRDIYVQHTDVLVLRQFLREDGKPLNRKITGLCRKQQKKLLILVKQARMAGLTLNLQPNLLDGSKPSIDPRKRSQFFKWNTYFDDYEKLIRTQKYL